MHPVVVLLSFMYILGGMFVYLHIFGGCFGEQPMMCCPSKRERRQVFLHVTMDHLIEYDCE